MKTVKTFRIKFQGKFVVECKEYGKYELSHSKVAAMTFRTVSQATEYASKELGLNVAHIRLNVTTTFTQEDELIQVANEWLPSNEVEQCVSCLKWFPMEQMRKGVVDRQTGLEFYCDTCYEEMDSEHGFLTSNALDDMFDNPLGQLDKVGIR